MTDIKNTEYITVNKDGIFVGGKPANTYRGEPIRYSNGVRKCFADIQRLNKNVAELHVLSSETRGEYAKPGNPSGKYGLNTWCRVKFEDGNLGAWVFNSTGSSAAYCAYYCACDCADYVSIHASFRSAVFGAANEKQNALTNALKDTDLSQFVGKPVQLNGYEIIVNKIAETKQIKR